MPDWLEAVDRELVASGVPARFRDRLLEELRDHLEDMDFEEGNREMSVETIPQEGWGDESWNARLGHPKEVAALARDTASRALFARRHPIVTYILLPMPLLILLWVGYAAGLVAVLSGFQAYRDQPWAVWLAGWLIHGLAFVPAAVLTVAMAWVAWRSRTAVGWWLAGGGLTGLVSAMLMVTFRVPDAPGTGMLQIGLGFPPAMAQWPQAAVPVLVTIGCVLYATAYRARRDLASRA